MKLRVALFTVLLAACVNRAFSQDDERPVRRTYLDNCLMCHSDEMSSRQRMTQAQWTASVDKMIGWGAPIPKEERDPLIAYLSAEFSPKTPPARIPRISPELALAMDRPTVADREQIRGEPARGAELHAKHCATCHGSDAKGGDLGTNLLGKTILLRPDDYRSVMRQGLRRMPGFRTVISKQDENDILLWLRSAR